MVLLFLSFFFRGKHWEPVRRARALNALCVLYTTGLCIIRAYLRAMLLS